MTKEYGSHYSVMLPETLEYLVPQNKEAVCNFADMTFGGGGHTYALADSMENCKVYSTDQDPDAIKNGLSFLKEKNVDHKVKLLKMNYELFPQWIEDNEPNLKFNGIIMDLGVSSHQFDEFDRGFSFREDAPLDMRMDYESNLLTAKEVLNDYDEEDIANILYKYGEERLSRRIAKAIIEKRNESPLETTKELEAICFHAYPKQNRFGKIHPATRTFQALRIYVNRELEVLENTLSKLYDMLEVHGRLAVISFHSLEDRIAKHKFKEISQTESNTAKIITKKPILPSQKELEENPRSRSAKLRVIEKTTMEGLLGKKKKYAQKNKEKS
jgi:16S rRNA (cytosine1402-N4)-methyltransferase